MANKQLPEFLTAENDLDGNELVYIAQSGKTRKTLLQKIKEFIIGTTTLTTTDTTITGALVEINKKATDNATHLNAKANKNNAEFTGIMKLNSNNVLTDLKTKLSVTAKTGFTIQNDDSYICNNKLFLNFTVKKTDGTAFSNTTDIVATIPYSTSALTMLSCGGATSTNYQNDSSIAYVGSGNITLGSKTNYIYRISGVILI